MIKLAYVNYEQIEYVRDMERERLRYIGEGRCYDCDRVVIGEAGGTLAGMLICADCAEQWTKDIDVALQSVEP